MGRARRNKIKQKENEEKIIVASLVWRSLAGIIDLLFAILLYWPFILITSYIFGQGWLDIILSQDGSLLGLVVMVTWVVMVITVNEIIMGNSIGKKMLGLYTYSIENRPLTRKEALIRNLLRFIDITPFFIPYMLGLIFTKVSNNNMKQRLGDATAGSVVLSRTVARGEVINVK